jgi:hypothetical protein
LEVDVGLAERNMARLQEVVDLMHSSARHRSFAFVAEFNSFLREIASESEQDVAMAAAIRQFKPVLSTMLFQRPFVPFSSKPPIASSTSS